MSDATTYLILLRHPTEDTWKRVGKQEATNGEHAVRKHHKATGDVGVLVAVPERSFRPRQIEMVQTTQVMFSQLDLVDEAIFAKDASQDLTSLAADAVTP